MHPQDAVDNSITDGDMVCIELPRGNVDNKARVTDEGCPGVLSSTIRFPEIM